MAKINLLPWREELREQRKKIFIAGWGGVIFFAVLIIVVSDFMISDAISIQQGRNRYLQNEIGSLDRKITEIKNIKKEKAQLVERMVVINGLQGNRPVIVRVFDELARIAPDGVYFKKLSVREFQLSLVGVAESNNRVSELMRKINSSSWFEDPNLTAVRKVVEDGERLNEFDLTFAKASPEGEESL
ncbi:PilN domain-containing protein [Endozoicomonas sp. Mp262]|uniref:PilN domain-containing protein n=1 Tax=Endozoicomonas sp. Mp262 TaxID=2919499 RepID=UPI0021D7D406